VLGAGCVHRIGLYTQTFCFNRFTSSGREPCRCTVGSGRGGGNRGLRFASDAHGGRPHDGAQAIAIPRLRRKGRRRHDKCSVESLEPRQYLSVNDGTSGALLLWQGSAPAGQLPPAPPAAVSGMPSAPNGLLVAPIGPGLSPPPGGLVPTSVGISQPGSAGQSIIGSGLLGGGTITTPSSGSAASGTSPTGLASGAPYSGSGQRPGGQTDDVESQLAGWPEYRKAWKDWYDRYVKPYVETAVDELAPPGYPMARDALEIGVKGGSIITVEQQAKRARQAMAEDPNGRGPLEMEEYERRKRQHNERSEP
jgi:hypothetical protein